MKPLKLLFLFNVFFLSIPLVVLAGEPSILLTVGESKLIHIESAKKIAIGNPSIAALTVVGDQEILISAKSAGNTNLIFLSPDGEKQYRTIEVSSRNLKKSMVEISVEIMEIQSQSALKAGLSWGSLAADSSGAQAPAASNNISMSESSPPPLVAIGSLTRQSLTASVQLLINRGKAKILAEPRLLAVSGQEASFLAGGEVPYIMENKLGSPQVQWKPYGVKLNIKPLIEGNANINASLRAEVSGLDTQNGISSGGTVIPAIRTRWVETTVYIKSGSTLVIAGLIENENQKLTSGIPIISDIPVIGELFRFTANEKKQTELVIFVTPSIVGQAEGIL
jgi:pilus assembly protein CpaC